MSVGTVVKKIKFLYKDPQKQSEAVP